MDRETLQAMVNSYDLVLVDTSFFGREEEARSLSEILYDVKDAAALENVARDIEAENIAFQLQVRVLATRDNVFTIPELYKELAPYLQALEKSYEWHNQKRMGEKKEPQSRSKDGRKNKRRTNRINKVKVKREMRMDDFDERYLDYTSPLARNALGNINSLIKRVKEAMRIPVYNGSRFRLPRMVEDVSEKVYKVVEAAIGYTRANPEHSVRILTQDPSIDRVMASDLLPQIVRVLERVPSNI